MDPASAANLRVLATAAIDAAGTFTLAIAPRAWPLRLVATGGSFVGGPDAGTVDPTRTLVALLPSATTDIANISINPLVRQRRAHGQRQGSRHRRQWIGHNSSGERRDL